MDQFQRSGSLPMGAVALAAMLAAGCTMCPDPYDYSGPVPNGSSPQNDFRARSNGILPLGATPAPWPVIVRKTGHDTPTLAAVDDATAETPADDVEPVSVLVAEDVEADGLPAEPGRVDPWGVVPSFATAEPDEAAALVETPGWRPRTLR